MFAKSLAGGNFAAAVLSSVGDVSACRVKFSSLGEERLNDDCG
jgi:hypothetical protein